MTFDPPSLPPAGWYPDPEHPHAQRYWNGARWEEAWQSTQPDHYPDIGDWLSEAFGGMRRHWRAGATASLLTVVPAGILLAVAARVGLADLEYVDQQIVGWSNDRLPGMTALGVGAVVMYLIGYVALMVIGLEIVDGDASGTPHSASGHDAAVADRSPTGARAGASSQPTWSSEGALALRSVGRAVRVLPRLIGWSIVAGVVGVTVFAVAALVVAMGGELAASLLFFAAFPLMIWIVFRLVFVYVAVVDRRGNPFARSWRATRGRWWSTFGRVLLLSIIIGAISMGINIVTTAFGGDFTTGIDNTELIVIDDYGTVTEFNPQQFRPTAGQMAVSAIGALLMTTIASTTSAVATARLYRNRTPRE